MAEHCQGSMHSSGTVFYAELSEIVAPPLRDRGGSSLPALCNHCPAMIPWTCECRATTWHDILRHRLPYKRRSGTWRDLPKLQGEHGSCRCMRGHVSLPGRSTIFTMPGLPNCAMRSTAVYCRRDIMRLANSAQAT